MKEFWIMWTYCANFSRPRRVVAESAEAAAGTLFEFFSDDFKKNGNIYVWEDPPVYAAGPDVETSELKRDMVRRGTR